jgi:hypothetical protein
MKQEMLNDLEEFGFKRQHDLATNLPMDKNIVLIPVKTRNQFRACIKNEIPMVTKRIKTNGRILDITSIPIDFDELVSLLKGYTL